jgi:hypothetical protein
MLGGGGICTQPSLLGLLLLLLLVSVLAFLELELLKRMVLAPLLRML